MRIFTLLLIISSGTVSMSSATNVILTHFNDLQNYARKLIDTKAFNATIITHPVPYIKLCEKLLIAPIYEMHSEFTNRNLKPTEQGYHTINKGSWNTLKNINITQISVDRKCHIAGKSYNLVLVQCIAHDSTLTWKVSYSQTHGIGLLFLVHPALVLYAMIDQSKKLIRPKISNPRYSFSNSIAESADESLCGLKRISYFRLCAISADGFHRKVRPSAKRKRQTDDEQEYADPLNNILYDPQDKCPQIVVGYRSSNDSFNYAEVQALHCHVSIKYHEYHIYVKLNLCTTKRSSLFIIKTNTDKSKELRGVIDVAQLENIFYMDNLF